MKLYVVDWSIIKYIKFLYKYFKKQIEMPEIESDLTCYFVSCGTWGAYDEEDDCVYVCPIDMDDMGMTMKELIEHEIAHVKHKKTVCGMSHKDKEKYINKSLDKK